MLDYFKKYGSSKNYRTIAKLVGQSTIKCHRRHLELTGPPEVLQNPDYFAWSAEEDEILRLHALEHGECDWKSVALKLGKRIAKECMRRYLDKIKPSHAPWSPEEDQRIVKLYEYYGPKWAKIAKIMGKNRSDQQIKRRYSQIK